MPDARCCGKNEAIIFGNANTVQKADAGIVSKFLVDFPALYLIWAISAHQNGADELSSQHTEQTRPPPAPVGRRTAGGAPP